MHVFLPLFNVVSIGIRLALKALAWASGCPLTPGSVTGLDFELPHFYKSQFIQLWNEENDSHWTMVMITKESHACKTCLAGYGDL